MVDLESVRIELERQGMWYPPDAIAAVDEGRDHYQPLDPSQTYPIREMQRKFILKAIAKSREVGADNIIRLPIPPPVTAPAPTPAKRARRRR